MMQHLDDYCCSAEMRGSFQETAPRKTAENTVKHHDGGVGSVVANHRGGCKSSVVVTTLIMFLWDLKLSAHLFKTAATEHRKCKQTGFVAACIISETVVVKPPIKS